MNRFLGFLLLAAVGVTFLNAAVAAIILNDNLWGAWLALCAIATAVAVSRSIYRDRIK